MARIVDTYEVFNHAHDEPFNIVRGVEWLSTAHYSYPNHPPLAPIALGAGPYIDGVRCRVTTDQLRDGNHLLYSGKSYSRTLALARAGNLIFFAFAAVILWRWSTKLHGAPTGLTALALFCMQPTILAHAGIATTDMAVTAAFLGLLYAFTTWMERPSFKRSLIFGIALGLALLSKFSTFVFFPVCVLAYLFYGFILRRRSPSNDLGIGRQQTESAAKSKRLLSCFLVFYVAFSTVWLFYKASVGLVNKHDVDPLLAERNERPPVVEFLISQPYPAPEFIDGVLRITRTAVDGYPSYFMGEREAQNGNLLYFPAILFLKTPLPFTLLFACGVIFAVKCYWFAGQRSAVLPVLFAIAIVVVVLPAKINIGVRHILPVYPFLAWTAGFGCVQMWRAARPRLGKRALVCAVVVWYAFTSISSHPDYLAYFNSVSGDDPSKIAVKSDLDWGQDLLRLKDELRVRRTGKVWLAYYGTAIPDEHGITNYETLPRGEAVTGWIAISLTKLRLEKGYQWLEAHKPVTTVGRSIHLYYIPKNNEGEN